jgi:hypothetical protein
LFQLRPHPHDDSDNVDCYAVLCFVEGYLHHPQSWSYPVYYAATSSSSSSTAASTTSNKLFKPTLYHFTPQQICILADYYIGVFGAAIVPAHRYSSQHALGDRSMELAVVESSQLRSLQQLIVCTALQNSSNLQVLFSHLEKRVTSASIATKNIRDTSVVSTAAVELLCEVYFQSSSPLSGDNSIIGGINNSERASFSSSSSGGAKRSTLAASMVSSTLFNSNKTSHVSTHTTTLHVSRQRMQE